MVSYCPWFVTLPDSVGFPLLKQVAVKFHVELVNDALTESDPFTAEYLLAGFVHLTSIVFFAFAVATSENGAM